MKFLQILVLIFVLSGFANAQKAILTGTIYDANGAVIPVTKIMAINEKGEKFETVTNDEGIYILNLPFNQYNPKADFKIAKYDITVEQKHFQKFLLKGFKFTPSYKGEMILDMALDVEEITNCGAGGCIQDEGQPIELSNQKVTDKILQRLLKELPKEQNETKRTANLSGRIYDQAGAIISEAKISLTNKEGKKFETFTNNDGFYEITVSSGTYLLEAEYPKHQAWEKFKIEKYEMASAVKMNLDIILPVSEEFTEKYGTPLTADPEKQNKTKRKNNKNNQ